MTVGTLPLPTRSGRSMNSWSDRGRSCSSGKFPPGRQTPRSPTPRRRPFGPPLVPPTLTGIESSAQLISIRTNRGPLSDLPFER